MPLRGVGGMRLSAKSTGRLGPMKYPRRQAEVKEDAVSETPLEGNDEEPAAGVHGEGTAASASGSHAESKARDEAALWDMNAVGDPLDLYSEEFDRETKERYAQRFAAQERQNFHEQEGSKPSWGALPEGAAPNPFGAIGSPSFGSPMRASNPWGIVGIIAGLMMPILGLLFGYLGLRRAAATGVGRTSSRVAIAVALLSIAINAYLVMTGAITFGADGAATAI